MFKTPPELRVIAPTESNSIAIALTSTLVEASLPIVIVLAAFCVPKLIAPVPTVSMFKTPPELPETFPVTSPTTSPTNEVAARAPELELKVRFVPDLGCKSSPVAEVVNNTLQDVSVDSSVTTICDAAPPPPPSPEYAIVTVSVVALVVSVISLPAASVNVSELESATI